MATPGTCGRTDGDTWIEVRPRLLEALSLSAEPGEHLHELATTLDTAGRQVADGLGSNPAVEVDARKLALSRLGPAPEPHGTATVQAIVQSMLPRVDFPDTRL